MPQPIQQSGQAIQGFATATGTKTAETSITATTSATGNIAMTAGPADFAAGVYDVEVFVPYVTIGSTNIDVELFVDGVFNQTLSGHLAASLGKPGASFNSRITLTQGIHTITVRAFVDAGTGKVGAGDGATGNPPNSLLIVKPA